VCVCVCVCVESSLETDFPNWARILTLLETGTGKSKSPKVMFILIITVQLDIKCNT
jgi:hypothetical protein